MAKCKSKKINPNTLSTDGEKYYSKNLINTDIGKGAGKGDAPRNCFSQKYRDNYNAIFRGGDKKVKK